MYIVFIYSSGHQVLRLIEGALIWDGRSVKYLRLLPFASSSTFQSCLKSTSISLSLTTTPLMIKRNFRVVLEFLCSGILVMRNFLSKRRNGMAAVIGGRRLVTFLSKWLPRLFCSFSFSCFRLSVKIRNHVSEDDFADFAHYWRCTSLRWVLKKKKTFQKTKLSVRELRSDHQYFSQSTKNKASLNSISVN